MRSIKIVVLIAMIFAPAILVAGGGGRVDQAWSAPGPITEIRVLRNVTVSQKDVTLLEICDSDALPSDWKSIMGGLNIGDAPQAGSEKFIDPGQLRSYLIRLLDSNGINSSDVKLDIPEKVVIKRESAQITQEMIEEIFKKFVIENSPWKKDDINIQRVHFSGIPVIPTGKMSYEVSTASAKERFIGNVTIAVDFYVNGEKARTLSVAGKVEVFGDVYMTSRPLKQNDIISSADLEVHKINITDNADRFATLPEQVENRRVLRSVGVHQPLELRDLDKPLVLKRGDPVRIVFEAPGLSVSDKGQANSDAAVGDTLAVTNINSKKTVYCRVVDGRTVMAVH